MHTKGSALETQVVDQLNALVTFERQITDTAIESTPDVRIDSNGKQLHILHQGLALHGNLDRPLIHQIGGRLWPDAGDFSDISQRWTAGFRQNKSQLESDIAQVFDRHDLKVRHVDKRGAREIYGIVTPHFVEVDQLAFRDAFLEEARRGTALNPNTKRVERTPLGNVVEYFQFDSPGFQVGFEYGLVYAKNTGYDAFKVDWGRYVQVCTNGLKQWHSEHQYKWYHTRRIALADFLQSTVTDGLANQRFLEARIQASRETALDQDGLADLIGRLSLAQATKQRLTARVLDESRSVGRNEWALSQALTYLGTHDRHISFRAKRQFTSLGTDILVHSLEDVLSDAVDVGADGYYSLLLPTPPRYH